MNYCVWINIVWLFLPNTQHGWFFLKNSFFTFCLPNRLTHQLFLCFHCYLIQPTDLNLLPWVMKRIQLTKYDLESSICGYVMNDQSNKSYTFMPKKRQHQEEMWQGCMERQRADKWRLAWFEPNMRVLCERNCGKMRDNWEMKFLSLTLVLLWLWINRT